jgi:hypothetical protein
MTRDEALDRMRDLLRELLDDAEKLSTQAKPIANLGPSGVFSVAITKSVTERPLC